MDDVAASYKRMPLHWVGVFCISIVFSLSEAAAEESLIQVRVPESWTPDKKLSISFELSADVQLVHRASYSETQLKDLPSHRMDSWTIKEKVSANPDELIKKLKEHFAKRLRFSQSPCRVELGYQTDNLAKCIRHQWGIEVYTDRTTRLGSYDYCMYSKEGYDRQVLVFFCSNNEERKQMDSIINKVQIR